VAVPGVRAWSGARTLPIVATKYRRVWKSDAPLTKERS
jgi:hypothetical protein